jgi:hypothetical protein
MTHTKSLSRRSVIAGSAAAVTAIPTVVLPVSSTMAKGEDAAMRELWQRFIDLELKVRELCIIGDECESVAWDEIRTLSRPWRPISHLETTAEHTDRRLFLEQICTKATLRESVWHVHEFQSKASHVPWLAGKQDDDPTRWHPYPDAQSEEEALALSEARAKKEVRSFKAKVGAINRKIGHRKAKAAVNDLWEASRAVRSEIATASITGATALAVKLALWAEGNHDYRDPDPEGCFEEIEAAGLESIYRHAVEQCGFDPVAALNAARKSA